MKHSIKDMVEKTLARSVASRNSDESLYESIVITYGYSVPMEHWPVNFILAMNRYRRYFQERGMYEAKKDVKEKRQGHSKWWKSEMMEKAKDKIQKINLRKKMRKI